MKNPEVLQRLDNAEEAPRALIKPADQSTPDSDLGIKLNTHEQIKISYYKPPIAGSFAPTASVKEGSDGESISSGDSSEENVYVVGQSEHDEECLNILSNGLDEDDDESEKFFQSVTLKETNIDEVILCAKMTEVIENNSPKKFKETSLIETPTAPVAEEFEESEESSLGSVDSGIHEAGTDHDSPVDDVLPVVHPKPTLPPKPTVTQKPSLAPKPTSTPKASTAPVPSSAPKLSTAPKLPTAPKPTISVPEPSKIKLPSTGPTKVVDEIRRDESGSSEESESEISETESEESESSSGSSDDRPPSPDGHEMTYLQYDEEPSLPKYKRDVGTEKKLEPVPVEHIPLPPEKITRAPSPASKIPKTEKAPEIPKTSLENFFSPPSRSELDYDGISKPKDLEAMRLKELRKQQADQQRSDELKAQQHLQRQIELKKQQEVQIEIERQQLEELQRHRELQRIQEMQRQELIRMQQEEQKRELELETQRINHMEEKKLKDIQLQQEREKQAEEQEKRNRQEMQAREEHQRQLDLLKQIEIEKQKQFEAERQHQEQQKQQKNVMVAHLHSEIDDIDSLLEGLMEMDPIIHQQSQQQKLKQLGIYIIRFCLWHH